MPYLRAAGDGTSPPERTSAAAGHAYDLVSLPARWADPGEDSWPIPAKDYANTRFSPLTQLTTANVGTLQVSFTFSTGVLRGHEAAPIVVNDTMYVVTPYPNYLYALDLTRPGAPMKWQIVAFVRSMSGQVPKDSAPSRSDHLFTRPSEQSAVVAGLSAERLAMGPDGTRGSAARRTHHWVPGSFVYVGVALMLLARWISAGDARSATALRKAATPAPRQSA